MLSNKKRAAAGLLLVKIMLATAACGDLAKKPLDARTRDRIDSLANAESQRVRVELDSFYNRNHYVLMQKKMDSLMVERRKEIARQVESARAGK